MRFSRAMSTRVIIVDLIALLLAAAGFHMAFRQRLVRRWWRLVKPLDPAAPRRAPRPDGEDPAHYALIIFGMMLMAFGLIIFSFTTAYALLI
jgi:hypothetical protein